MEKPLRSRRKLVMLGCSAYVIIPKFWKHSGDLFVNVEVYDDKIVITPSK